MTTKAHLRIKTQEIDFNKYDLMDVLLKLNYYREFVRSSKNKLSIGWNKKRFKTNENIFFEKKSILSQTLILIALKKIQLQN